MSVAVEGPTSAADRVTAIALFNERNPQPDVFVAHLGPRAGRAIVSTRIRLATSQTLVALAGGMALSALIERAIRFGIRLKPEMRSQFPMLEERLNAFIPTTMKVARIAIAVVVAALVLDADVARTQASDQRRVTRGDAQFAHFAGGIDHRGDARVNRTLGAHDIDLYGSGHGALYS